MLKSWATACSLQLFKHATHANHIGSIAQARVYSTYHKQQQLGRAPQAHPYPDPICAPGLWLTLLHTLQGTWNVHWLLRTFDHTELGAQTANLKHPTQEHDALYEHAVWGIAFL